MPKYRGYSLTPGSPAERRFSTTRYLFHYSQPCVLSRDKFNSCFSFVPAVTPELSALLRFCGSSPAPGASHTPWGPAAHGEIQPCRGHHPAGPSRSQQLPAAPSRSHSDAGKSLADGALCAQPGRAAPESLSLRV